MCFRTRFRTNYTQTGGEETRDSQWWKSFESPELNQLMDEALGANLNLAQYAARLQQKQALAQKAGASPTSLCFRNRLCGKHLVGYYERQQN